MQKCLPITDELKEAARAAEDSMGAIPWERLKECDLMEITVRFVSAEACEEWRKIFDLLACASDREPPAQIQLSLQLFYRCSERFRAMRSALDAAGPPLSGSVIQVFQKELSEAAQLAEKLNEAINRAQTGLSKLPRRFRQAAINLRDMRS